MDTSASDIAVDGHYDLIIIGTGSGNSIPGPEFEDESIAIIEKGTFGGTCLNVGCIPTKMYVYAADAALETAQAGRLGVNAQVNSVDWSGMVTRIFEKRIDPIAGGGEEYRRGPQTPNIDVYDQHAVFVGERHAAHRPGPAAENHLRRPGRQSPPAPAPSFPTPSPPPECVTTPTRTSCACPSSQVHGDHWRRLHRHGVRQRLRGPRHRGDDHLSLFAAA